MCGIAGIVGSRETGRQAALEAMSRSVAHRGPDDVGEWSDDFAALAHRRLSILDTSPAGHQPMVSESGRYVITYNGEIYNYLELRKELEARGHQFRSKSDTEVILAAFREYGAECAALLNGMWAFAIWDRQERTLFVSRDRFGKKPFYYAIQGGQFIFASEIKALLATGMVRPEVNPAAVADFCAERVSDHGSATFFKGVDQLPPGCCGTWKDGTLRISPFWALPPDAGAEGDSSVEEIWSLLEDAVKLRLRSDVPVGTLLSGGLDSSGVTCIASQHHDGTIEAFSTLYDPPLEEANGIGQVLSAHRNVRLHSDRPDAHCLDDVEACLWHQEEPFADGSMLAHFRLMRLARESGIKVLLSGQGADEVFAGYPSYLPFHLAGLIARGAWGEARQFYLSVRQSGQAVSLKSALGYALPSALAQGIRSAGVRRHLDWLAPDFARVSPIVLGGYTKAAEDADPLNGALRESILRRTLPGFLHYEDRNSMAFGVETRLPYLDFRLVSKVLPLPGRAKVRGGITKSLLRDALNGKVPDAIVWRAAKQGYPAPLPQWLRSFRGHVEAAWIEQVKSCPMIIFERWRAHYRTFLAGSDDELPAVWRGLILALWYRRFIEGRTPR